VRLRFRGATEIDFGDTDESVGIGQIRVQSQRVLELSDALCRALESHLDDT
jgi:hypothetical protein